MCGDVAGCMASFRVAPLDMRESDCAGLDAAVHVLEAADVAVGWLTVSIGGVAVVVVRLSLGAMDVGDVGKSEPGALGRVSEAGEMMATLLGDVTTLAVTVWGGEGAGDVALVHMVSRQLWGGVG